jgi:hypothetical protein
MMFVYVNGELIEPGAHQEEFVREIQSVFICFFSIKKVCQVYRQEDRGELQCIRNGSIFFARNDSTRNTFRVFCEASGQKINLEKSSVFFGHHCPDHVKEGVKARLEV